MPPGASKALASFAVAVSVACLSLSAQIPQPGQTVFRGSTLVVPVDVRVLDRKGLPVTDLTAKDFRVFEDGRPQEIRHFSAVALTPGTPDPSVPLRQPGPPSLAPQNRRLFLIVLGRGRLQGPSKGIDAVQDFVRGRLLPQDLVAVMAWNRATDFTADHDRVASVIGRFRVRHEEIETDLRLLYSGLSGLYAGRQIPRPIQLKIDDVFAVPDTASREVLPSSATARAGADARDIAQRKSEIEARTAAYRQFNTTDLALADLMAGDMGQSFDDYVALNRQTLQDVGNVYAGIDYLRFIEGEKHLLLVTEQGFLMPSADYDRDVASLAADARVAIDTFQTGGVAVQIVGGMPVVPNGFALSALRSVSEASGGQVSISEHGTTAIDRLVHSTAFGYVLGYSPANAELDGKFRKIKIEVVRKDLKVAYRHGYFARPVESFDPRKSIAMTRMVSAANYPSDINDLKLSIKVSDVRSGAVRSVTVETFVPVERLVFARTADGSLAAISQAVLCMDTYGAGVGEVWRTLNVTVRPENYDEIRKNGLKLTVNIPVTINPAYIKVIVYDYGSDLLGTTRLRRF